MYVLGTIKARRAAGTDAIGTEGLDSFLFQRLVCDKIVEVQRSKVRNGAAVGELRLRSSWPTLVLAVYCTHKV